MSRIVDLLIFLGLACFIYALIVKVVGKDIFVPGNAAPLPSNYIMLALVVIVLAIAVTMVQIRDRLK